MQGNGGLYAVKKRRKPVQKNVKPPPVKTNPSKRHRDRLNIELDHLTGLLPFSEEVRGRLDKLSVLRLSVGYLKVKSYFHAVLQKNARSAPLVCANGRNGQPVSLGGVGFSEGELLLQALNGFVLVVTTDGTIFYTSSTIQDFLGFHQSDVLHQSVYDFVHMDDREMFKCQLHFALNPSETDAGSRAEDGQSSSKALSSSQSFLPQYIPPENSSFLERSFCCRLRCLLDSTSGFVALNFTGRLKYLHLQGNAGADGTGAPPQLALFAIATPLQSPSVMEIRTKTLIFQTKHRMDFAPVGIDTRGKLVLGYTEVELVTTGSGYQFIHAADMMYCADNHLRMIKTGDSGFTIFRLLTKTGHWLWVQASARIVFKGGRPDFIIARQKALTNEEGEEHLRQRRQQLPFNLATGEGVLYDVSLDDFSIPGPPGPAAPGTAEPMTEKPLDPASLLGSLRRQDHSVYSQPEKPGTQVPVFSQTGDTDCEPQLSFEQAFLDSHALLSVPGQVQTLQKRSVTGDLTSEAMIDSLEQILGDIGDGGIEGFDLEETELRDWENTLIRMNQEREDSLRELNHTLANDVFSYVEEALRRETGGFVAQGSDQTGCHISGTTNSLSVQGEHPRFSNNVPQWQPAMDNYSNQSGFGEQALGEVGNATGLKGASPVVSHRTTSTLTPAQCRNTHHAPTSSLWPPSSSNHHSGNERISTQSRVTHQSWLPSAQNTDNIHSSHQACLEVMHQSVQYSLNHTGSQQTCVGQEPRGPSVWQQPQQQQQQQQLPQSFHHHRLSHSSHTPGGLNSTVQSFRPHTQRLSGSCMYEKREGHIPNAATLPTGQNWPLLGPTRSRGPTHVSRTATNAPPFTLSHPGGAVPGIDQGMMSSTSTRAAACTDVGGISLGHLSGSDADRGPLGSEYHAKNASLQSSFFCWNSEAQIPKVSLNGAVDPFAFPALPTGSINLSQNTGP
ncbi:aryl hydrocarbon receptor-like [Xiphias gladius]|uniref:aryl hydrocarbon receptor-like n=1 Tax=Xiphias gladius TaxID=8245 RepID=UPI001A9873AB|nr:aryl hydrocarbon receptor-like [Xiphias gladius]XP_040012829.1 aryl hydrocarbon receptor-like [Xiphias gladius]